MAQALKDDCAIVLGMKKGIGKVSRWKSVWYLVSHDGGRLFRKMFFQAPLGYAWRFCRAMATPHAYRRREGDLFFYGIDDTDAFLRDTGPLVVAFSYCQKPKACPSGRFCSACSPQGAFPCDECFIAKCRRVVPRNTVFMTVPTVHDIGGVLCDVMAKTLRPPLFLVTSCPMSLAMFGDFSNILGFKGIGVQLLGRVCGDFRAFELAERGVKPGLTHLGESAEAAILAILEKKATLWHGDEKPPAGDTMADTKGTILHVDETNFDSTVSSGLVLVDFSAEWCGPCRALAPVLDQVAGDMAGKVKIAKLDIDSCQATTARFRVTSVPTLILFKNGDEVDRLVGLRDAKGIERLINAQL